MRVSVSAWVGQEVRVYRISFIGILCSSPLQKCVLTLDDVMLQVQRIYVNNGVTDGWGGGVQESEVAGQFKIY